MHTISDLDLTIVVPFFNEGENVNSLCSELREVLREHSLAAELILVDDGSSDDTPQRLHSVARNWPECRVLGLAENQGQSAALLAGFAHAHAPIIVTLDGDAQNDPRDIPLLLSRLEGADMVVGVRRARRDSWARRYISRLANLVRSRALGDGVSDAGCALKVFRREVLSSFIPIRTLYSFMPAFASAAGFRVTEATVNHRFRPHGKSRYSTAQFLALPIVDFIGVAWYCARRCRARGSIVRMQARRGFPAFRTQRHAQMIFGMVLATCLAVVAWFSLSLLAPADPFRNAISNYRAERIALQQVPDGALSTEELRLVRGELNWMIDVKRSQSPNLLEVNINAQSGRVVSTREETPAEDALEEAVEEHQISPADGAKK